MLRPRRILRCALPLAAVLFVSACTQDGREPVLSATDTVPAADPTTQTNQNSTNPVLNIPTTFPVRPGDALTLVWSDEFNGAALDPQTWFFATGDGSEVGLPGGWGNNELQYYLPDNAQLEDGVLKITARRESIGGLNYTSARINTQDRFAFQYGRFEASIKLPAGQGLWPAFWMLSQDSDYLCDGEPCVWAATGEIDIVEAVNLEGTGGNEIFATIHYGDEFPGNQSSSVTFTPGVSVTAGFHTYAMEWDPDEIRWYFNDELYATQSSATWFSTADNGGPNAPFDQPFHILLNLAVGGNFPGNGIDSSIFPATMEVDWVRVYSGEDTFVPANPGTIPDAVVYATDPAVTEDLAPPGGIQNFGSGAVFDPAFAGDRDFSPVLATTSGDAYDPGNVQVGFAAFTGYMQGFASSYGTIDFKVKGLPTGEIEVKFFGGDGGDGSADNAINYNVTTYAGSTALGNGWYQVSIPLSDFASTININEGFLLGPPGDQGAQFTFFLTDVGFSGTPGGGSGELITNGDFEAGSTPWLAGVSNPIDPALVVDDGGNNIYRIDVTAAGNPFDVNLSQILPITPDETYTLTFRARSDRDRTMIAGIGLSGGSFANTAQSVDLTTAWQTYTLELTATGFGDAMSRVLFDMGAEVGLVEIDDVSLVVTPPFDSGLLTNGDFEAGPSPWLAGVTNPIDPALIVDDGSNSYYSVDVMAAGNPFDVNLSQILPITPDETYTLSFMARASVARTMIAGIGLSGGSFANTAQTVNLTTDWQMYTLELTATGFGDSMSRVLFDMGAEVGRVDIDDVSLVVSAPFDPGLLTNGDFEAGSTPWLAGVSNPIDPALVVDDGSNSYYSVDVMAAGNPFDVNLSQILPITPDETYTLSFMARASVARTMIAGIGLSGGSFANTAQTVNLTTDWQMYTLELTATGFGDDMSRVLFDMGAEVGRVDIDDVSLVISTGGGGPAFDPGLLTNGDFQSGASPWLAGVSNPIDPALIVDDGSNSYYSVDVMAAGNPFDVNLSQILPITPDETYTLSFMARASVARTMIAGIGLSGGSFANTAQTVNLTTDWQMYTLELTATGFGDDMSRVLFDMGAEVGRVDIDDVSLVVSTGGGGGGGGSSSLANGDFETGGLAGWSQFQFPTGVGSITADTSMQGGRAGTVGRLIGSGTAASANDVVISQENLAAGTVMPGDSIDVTFDLYGSLMQPGAAVFVEVIFLDAAGNDVGGRNFLNGDPTPYTPTNTWTSYSGTVIAGTGFTMDGWDVSGGLTLSLKGTCGAVDGCGFDASFDNVTFTVTPVN